MSGYRGHLAAGGVAAFGISSGILAFGIPLADGGWIFPDTGILSQLGITSPEMRKIAYVVFLSAICVLFSLWPDADTDSKGQRLFGGLLFLSIAGLMVLQSFKTAATLGLFGALPMMARHRGWTHSWWAMVMVPLPLLILPYLYARSLPALVGLPYYLSAVIGYATHLLLDGQRIF